jgi:hypothetical protein
LFVKRIDLGNVSDWRKVMHSRVFFWTDRQISEAIGRLEPAENEAWQRIRELLAQHWVQLRRLVFGS